jgi:hypothetical protein
MMDFYEESVPATTNASFDSLLLLPGCPAAAQGIKKPKFDDISVSVYPKGYLTG